MSEQNTAEQWARIEDYRDQLQAQLDRLDAFENLDPANRDGAERARLDAAIEAADEQCEAAERAFHREGGDSEMVRELEMRPFERALIVADVFRDPEGEQ
ncbi:MAG: hypothetical protein WKF29_02010 [Thermoleophilaceae bacterium]